MNNGIQPTVELATNNGNGFYPYPVMYGNGFGGNGFGNGSDWIWIIVLLALLGWGNNGNGGFGNNGFDNGYAWLSNGQKEIMTNTNNGFDTLHLSNQLDTVNSGIYSLSNQLCNCCADINSNVSNGFFNAEIAENNRQMANMNQLFGISTQLCNASADNRLATCQTQNIVQNEGNATRFADANNTRDIITNATANTQAILDKLCQLELDNKQSKIDELERQNLMLSLDKSQTAQNAFIANSLNNEIDLMYNRLVNCPIPSTPVYGRTAIFSCPQNNGCGCGYNTTSQFI